MQRTKPINPLLQSVKGIFVFNPNNTDYAPKALELLKSLQCQVLSTLDNRVTVKSTRGNLQKIKQCWLSKSTSNEMSANLNKQVSQIIIGGNVN